MQTKTTWEGSPAELLKDLTALAIEHRLDIRDKHWPKLPHQLTRALNELAANLVATGLDIGTGSDLRTKQGRRVRITQMSPVPGVAGVAGSVTTTTERHPELALTNGLAAG